MINIIVAVSENDIIGGDNKLLWNIPEDLKWFKKITTGNTVIMGRKTFESIGKALPNRENIVITRQKNYNSNCITVSSINEAILKSDRRKDIFIIGGGQVYQEALKMDIVDNIYLTRVHNNYDGDTKFIFDENKYLEVEKEIHNGYTFITYRRLRNT
jgi:dihydrofolate reductase